MEIYNTIISQLREFSIPVAIIRLTLAVAIGAFVGFERERHGRAAGLRTHILVCMGAAMATLIGHYNSSLMSFTADPMRIGAQVISGIGFLGVGTIVSKGRFQVTGLTTAAGLWATATIGLAIGIGFYEAAIFAAILEVVTMTLLSRFDARIFKKNKKIRVYIETSNVNSVGKLINHLETDYKASGLQVTTPRSGISQNAGIEVTLRMKDGMTQDEVLKELTDSEYVVFALLSI